MLPFVVTPPGYHMSTVEARAAKIAYIRLAAPTHHLLDVGVCVPGKPQSCQRVTAISTSCVASDGHHGSTQHRFRGLCDVAAKLNWTSIPLCRVVLARVIPRSALPAKPAVPWSGNDFIAAGWWNKPAGRVLFITPRVPDYFHVCSPYQGPG